MRGNLKKRILALLLCLFVVGALSLPSLAYAGEPGSLLTGMETDLLPEDDDDGGDEDPDPAIDPEPEDPNTENPDPEDPDPEDPDPDEGGEEGGEEDGEDGEGEEPEEEEQEETEEDEEFEEELDEAEEEALEGAEEAEEEIEAFSLVELDANTVIVDTYADFETALSEDNGYTYIYLGDNIAQPSTTGFTINANKAAVTIDGSPPGSGASFTYSQAAAGEPENTISLASANTTSVTLQNINVAGQNHYGVVHVPNGTAYSGTTLIFNNVTYAGPQPVFNRYGAVQYNNCTFTMQAGYSPIGEIAEANRVSFSGSFNASFAANSGNAVFLLSNANPSFAVEAGASVVINGLTYGFYLDDQTNGTFSIGAGANFDFTLSNGYSPHTFNTMALGAGSTYALTLNGTDTRHIRLRNTFTMEEGSNFYYTRAAISDPAIEFTLPGATANFNNPGRVVIRNGSPTWIGDTGGTMALNMTTDALNMWTTANAADSIDNTPDYIWNKANESGEKLTLSVPINTNVVQPGLSTNYDTATDPGDTALTSTTFQAVQRRQVVLGQVSLAIDQVSTISQAISGTTSGSAVRATYQGSAGEATISGAGGSYSLPLGGDTPVLDTTVSVLTHGNMLKMRQETIVVQGIESLSFGIVPEELPFETTKVPGQSRLVPRVDDDWAITVRDTRVGSAGFHVDASVRAALSGGYNGNTVRMENALVFLDANGQETPLSSEALTVYSSNSGGTFNISWAADRGPLVRAIPGNVYSNVQYSAVIEWDLVDGP